MNFFFGAFNLVLNPACFNSRLFCNKAIRLLSSSIRSLAFLVAFLPLVLANLALASDNISFSSSSKSIASGLATLVSGLTFKSPTCRSLLEPTEANVSAPNPLNPNSFFESLASESSRILWYLSIACVAVLPIFEAIDLHWFGISLARFNNFSSSSADQSDFLSLGSRYSFHLALACLAVLRANKEATLDHWLSPYLDTAAFKISSRAIC